MIFMKQQIDLNKIAFERCEKLLSMARKVFLKNPARAKRYVSLARKIAMHHRIHIDNKSFCKKCGQIFVAGVTLLVRLDSKNKRVVYVCAKCGAKKAFGYSKRAKQ